MSEPQPFSFEALTKRAQAMAGAAYQPPVSADDDILEKIDYDAHGKLNFKRSYSPFASGKGVYPATFFHLGRYFRKPVSIYMLENGVAREIIYEPHYFDMPKDSIARQLPEDVGFAGFRLHENRERDDWKTQDWVAFLGASYFRAIGSEGQYGLSARGIAVNTAAAGGEEFPDFREFYIEQGGSADEPVTVYALLDGPSISGAFKFQLLRGTGVLMEVEQYLYLRKDIERLGIAPLTSMFWYSELNHVYSTDWRPEIHDSDGLELWTGAGERIWRQLNNPDQVRISAFADKNPKGFGLMQRDREVTHYLDGVRYHRRPGLWVEPLGDWDEGAVQLVEIPTDDETHDNIAAFWTPAKPARAGQHYHYRYRLYWQAEHPFGHDFSKVVATRTGRGGEPGTVNRPKNVTKFSVEFSGEILGSLAYGEFPEVVVNASRGKPTMVKAEPIMDTRLWRAYFDLAVEGDEPVDLRMYLRRRNEPLSETWLYQFIPALKGY